MKGNTRTYLIYLFLLCGFCLKAYQTTEDSLVQEQEEPSIKEFFTDKSQDEEAPISELIDILVEENDVPETQEWDTSGIALVKKDYVHRNFDTIKINEFKTLEQFDYTEAQSKDSPFLNWLRRLISRLFSEHQENTGGGWIKYLIIIGASILIVLFLLRNEFKSLIKKKDKEGIKPQAGDLDITIHEDIICKNLKDAEDAGRYREAIRFQYLKVLKKLNEDNLIDWKDYKLSQDYVNEIKNEGLKNEFKQLTEYFNYSWYGNYEVDSSFYSDAKKHISQIESLSR